MMNRLFSLDDSELDKVSGGASAAGTTVKCKVPSPLYRANPVGLNSRSVANTLCTVPTGADVKLFESGGQFCKVIYEGKIGWIETSSLTV